MPQLDRFNIQDFMLVHNSTSPIQLELLAFMSHFWNVISRGLNYQLGISAPDYKGNNSFSGFKAVKVIIGNRTKWQGYQMIGKVSCSV